MISFSQILILLLFIYPAQFSVIEVFGITHIIPTPHFDLGNRDFNVTGKPILGKGCHAVQNLDHKKINHEYLALNSSKRILLVEYNEEDNSCFLIHYALECQKYAWCGGVLVQDHFFNPTGLDMWSVFDIHRERTEYKVPLTEASFDDFNFISSLILDAESKNQTTMIILTNDPNPWQTLFLSIPWMIFFRILSPIWSIGCLIFVIRLLFVKHRAKVPIRRGSFNQLSMNKNKTHVPLKSLCLGLHALTHVARVVAFSVDPFVSQQIFPHLVYYLLGLAFIITFDIATNILLVFVVRELTRADKSIDLKSRLIPAYCFVLFFVILDFLVSALGGLKVNFRYFPTWIVKAFFYVVMNIFLGLWYMREGYLFLSKYKKLETKMKKQNRSRVLLTRMTIVSSIGIILVGMLSILITLPQVFGNPTGHFCCWVSIVTVVQILSLAEISLFGGVVLDVRTVITKLRALSSSLTLFGTDTCDL
eukprot:c16297_g1_i1.p1 GENE.c16297_g1_i1~~c16297_g1_i1.p1  ORF type:complete len:477 (-),score=64.73 c16297_g1_i1:131-1561(-)